MAKGCGCEFSWETIFEKRGLSSPCPQCGHSMADHFALFPSRNGPVLQLVECGFEGMDRAEFRATLAAQKVHQGTEAEKDG